jgi:hypothetical protein
MRVGGLGLLTVDIYACAEIINRLDDYLVFVGACVIDYGTIEERKKVGT